MTTRASLLLVLPLAACAIDAPAPVDSNTDDYYVDGKEDVARPGKFETFTGADGKYYFHMIASNGEKVLQSQGYTSATGAKSGIASVRTNGTNPDRFRVQQAADGEWYFDLRAGNGQTIATSEMYVSESNATRAVAAVEQLVAAANVGAAEPDAKFQVFRGFDGAYYFHLRANNGEIVLQSQPYTRRASAVAGTASVRNNGAALANYEIRDAANGEAYFVLDAGNGWIIGVSETYYSTSNAERGAQTVAELLADGGVIQGPL
jgi:uncharacterized protein